MRNRWTVSLWAIILCGLSFDYFTRTPPVQAQVSTQVGIFGPTGQQTVTSTATALPVMPISTFCVKALAANSSAIYIGSAGVSASTGWQLSAGDVFCDAQQDLSKIYVVGTGGTIGWQANTP